MSNRAAALGGMSGTAKRSSSTSGIVLGVLKYVLLISLTISFIFPFFWMATSVLKNDDQCSRFRPYGFRTPPFPKTLSTPGLCRISTSLR